MTKFSRPVWWFYYLFGLFTKFCVFKPTYVGDLSKRPGPALIVGKHASYWDIYFGTIVVRKIFKVYPHFEMGTFFGYPMLSKLQASFERYGAFPVMRPKDLIRIKHATGKSKEELVELMEKTNGEAAEARRWVLRNKRALVYYPEGGRASRLKDFRSKHEMQEAIEAAAEGHEIQVIPVLCLYEKKPKIFIPLLNRRRVTVKVLPPVLIRGRGVDEVLDEIHAQMEKEWTPEAEAAVASILDEKSPGK